jgi:hypothetical protein
MSRINSFSLRLTLSERQMIAAIAQRLERTQSDAMRFLLREKAHELGVIPTVVKSERDNIQTAS